MSGLGPSRHFDSSANYFRSWPESGHRQGRSPCLKGATFGLMHRRTLIGVVPLAGTRSIACSTLDSDVEHAIERVPCEAPRPISVRRCIKSRKWHL